MRAGACAHGQLTGAGGWTAAGRGPPRRPGVRDGRAVRHGGIGLAWGDGAATVDAAQGTIPTGVECARDQLRGG